MAMIQRTFAYLGDPDVAPVEKVDLVAAVPEYHYAEVHEGEIVRTVVGEVRASTPLRLTASRYTISLPDNAITGAGADQLSLWKALRGSVLESGRLDDLTVPVRLSAESAGSLVWSTSVNAIPIYGGSSNELERVAPLVLLVGSAVAEAVLRMTERGVTATATRLLGVLEQATLRLGSRLFEADVFDEVQGELRPLLDRYQVYPEDAALEVLKEALPAMADFVVELPAIRGLQVAGTFRIDAPDATPAVDADLAGYRLTADLTVADPVAHPRQQGLPRSRPLRAVHDWAAAGAHLEDGKTPFDLTELHNVPAGGVDSPVSVVVTGFDGAVLWHRQLTADDPQLTKLEIVVPVVRPVVLEARPSVRAAADDDRLRGRVVSLEPDCTLGGLTVVLMASTAGDVEPGPWRVVGAATTDPSGSFSMPFPAGDFIGARATVSAAPNRPVDLVVHPDRPGRTIDDGFLYILIEPGDCDHQDGEAPDDCACHATTSAPRLPGHAELLASDEFSQDIGGTCINLTTPNRTINEYGYTAIVRTSDPDVTRYVLERSTRTLVDGAGESYEFSDYMLYSDNNALLRTAIAVDNPIHWQDAPTAGSTLTFYQAASVATGHVLHYRAEFRADGYSLGNLLYSLPLAPGQKKQIVVLESTHTLTGAETQSIAQGESLAASLIDERGITNDLGGNIAESLSGSSRASTSGVSAGLGAAASFGPFGASLGVAGGFANSSASSSQAGSRSTALHFGEKLRQSIMQNAQSYRQLNASVVKQVEQGQSYTATTDVVANHNHCHSLTMMYFEVLRHYAIYQELTDVEECVFVPLLLTSFSQENIHKWRDVLVDHLLPLPSNTYLRPFGGVARHPLTGAFDANERIRTAYANVDFPAHRYCDDTIDSVSGRLTLRVRIPRPRTRFDRILSLPIIRKQVTTQGGVDVGGTIGGAIKDSVVGALTGGLSVLSGGGPKVKYTTETHEVLTAGKIFDNFMTLDENYESVPPARCIRVHGFEPMPFTDDTGPRALDLFGDMTDDAQLWDCYAKLLTMQSRAELLAKFNGNVIGDWDRLWDSEIAPRVLAALFDESTFSIGPLTNLDVTSVDPYAGGDRRVAFTFTASTTSTRAALPALDLRLRLPSDTPFPGRLKAATTLSVTDLTVNYTTAHYRGRIFSGGLNFDLIDQVVPPIGGHNTVPTPMNSDEKRNPRKEDAFIVNRLLDHLNSNLEYYNRMLWARLDRDRRYMLLDGFAIQIYDSHGNPTQMRSLASIVRNEPLDVAGNSIVLPVAAGYRVSSSFIVEQDEDGHDQRVSLLDHYQPLTPVPPYRLSVASRGVYLEAVKGACDACEPVEENTSQDWDRFRTEEPTPIGQVTPPTPTIIDWQAVFKDFAQPLVAMQQAPAQPAPGAGLAGLAELLGKADAFRDSTGLAKTQENVMQTYLSNQENAKAFAAMAQTLAQQQHNTQNSARIMETARDARDSGAMSQEDYGSAVRDHVQMQIDGRPSEDAAQRSDTASHSQLGFAIAEQVASNATIDASQDHRDGTRTTVSQVGTPTGAADAGADAGAAAVGPFPPAVGNPLVANGKMQAALDRAIAALEAKRSLTPGTLAVRFTVADVTAGGSPFPAAHHLETKMDYVGSSIKVAVMYSAFALRDMARRYANAAGVTTSAALFAGLAGHMKQPILGAIPQIASATNITDKKKLPDYGAVLAATPTAGGLDVQFTPAFKTALERMIVPSSNDAAATCVHGVGYGYLNAALAIGGFLDLGTSPNGLWVAGDFQEEKVWPYVRVVSANDGPTAMNGTTSHMARLVSLIVHKRIIDPVACQEMLDLLAEAAVGKQGLEWDQPWIDRAPRVLRKDCITHNKLGLGPLKSHKEVRSEVSVLAAPLKAGKRYVVAWQNLTGLAPITLTDIATLIRDTIADYEL